MLMLVASGTAVRLMGVPDHIKKKRLEEDKVKGDDFQFL